MRSDVRLFCCWASLLTFLPTAPLAAETDLPTAAATFVSDFCFDCHGESLAEAHINLEQMTSTTVADGFKQWQRVATMIEQKRMPPADAAQPDDVQRRQIVQTLQHQLLAVARQHAGDPGYVVMRRLTSAEYGYTIQDLTGLDLDVGRQFVSDAVGGAGFTNVGSVQFVQAATLERYLEAAKQVADHAVIGAGPLLFFRDPGKTGRELSAIDRIQKIYREHGFRHASGEGGEPFGLEKYAKAFYVAWRFRFRQPLGIPTRTLADLAAAEQLDARFAHHIWLILNEPRPSFPTSEIVSRWQALSAPGSTKAEDERAVRQQCDKIYECLHQWQKRLSTAAHHPEEAAELTGDVTELAKEAAADIDVEELRAGVLEFAERLPQVSHQEPAPSDRDPIPQPFDNSYNKPERNFFHTHLKYHRDDQFLVSKVLDDETRQRLDQAWIDLLTSFEYHDVYLRFVADKFELELGDRRIADLDEEWIDRLAEAPRKHIRRLYDHYHSAQKCLMTAEPGHVDDAIAFASLAWRRPLTDEEKLRLRAFYEYARSQLQLNHEGAIRALLTRILVAPEFIYRAERSTPDGQIRPLSDWELANRLSYFLWSSLPDEKLRRAASAGELRNPEQLAAHAARMLRAPKARRFATEFFGQWFGFYQFDRYSGVDTQRFPEFTESLRTAMYDEAVSFFDHIVRHDRPVREMLLADYTFVNDELAEHYGLPHPASAQLQQLNDVQRSKRGGLLSLGAVLTVTSAPLRTSPVKRGDWILRRVLGTPVPPPPADAGSIPADDELTDGLSIRQRLEAHRRDTTCVNCHSRIDPLGFALERYDAIGRRREHYRDGTVIDAQGTLLDGSKIEGVTELRDYLFEHQSQFHRTLATKLLGYALGRRESVADALLLDQMVKELETDGRFSGIVRSVVTSKQFRTKR